MKQTLLYQPHSFGTHACRLRVEGFPDVSTGQGGGAVGILTGWSLDWVGHPQLEGRREHLQALMATVLPYARHVISGVPRAMGEEDDPVTIAPDPEGGHRVRLRSGQPDTPPLDLRLDDAELADLVRVLDQCRLDPRLQLPLPVPEPLPLAAREVRHRLPLRRRLAAPVGGLAALALAAGVSSLLPPPRPPGGPQQARTSQSLPPTPAVSPPSGDASGKAPPSGATGNKASPSGATGSKALPSDGSAASPPAPAAASRPAPPPAASPAAAAPSPAPAETPEARLTRLRAWLLSRQPTSGAAPQAQSWQLAVNQRGEVVAASPVEGNTGQDRARLGLPAAAVPAAPARETLLVRGDLRSPGFWELAPWHGW